MVFRYLFFFILMVLSCVTFNARGLMDMGKFERVKEKNKGEDVIALQETNWKESVMMDYKKKWEGDILYNNGDGRLGRGVAILMRKDVFNASKVVYKDKMGKCMVVEVNYEGCELILVNVHAPTEEKEKKEFFNVLRNIVNKCCELFPRRSRDQETLGYLSSRSYSLLRTRCASLQSSKSNYCSAQ